MGGTRQSTLRQCSVPGSKPEGKKRGGSVLACLLSGLPTTAKFSPAPRWEPSPVPLGDGPLYSTWQILAQSLRNLRKRRTARLHARWAITDRTCVALRFRLRSQSFPSVTPYASQTLLTTSSSDSPRPTSLAPVPGHLLQIELLLTLRCPTTLDINPPVALPQTPSVTNCSYC